MRRVASWVTLGALLGGAPAAAQLCAGLPPFAERPFQLLVTAVFNNSAQSFAGGLAAGGAGPFGHIEVGITTIDIAEQESFYFGGGAGYQVPLNQRATAQLCPAAQLGFLRGPKDVGGSGLDYSETDVGVGLAAGFIATGSRHAQLVPTASLILSYANPTLTDASGNSSSDPQWFGILELGVGIMFGREISLKPSVVTPLGLKGGSTAFAATVAIGLGSVR